MRTVLEVSLVLAAVALSGCGAAGPVGGAAERRPGVLPFLDGVGLETERWREAGIEALANAEAVELPHAERGTLLAFSPVAKAYTFAAHAGQTLKVRFEPVVSGHAGQGRKRRVLVDLFLLREQAAAVEYLPIDAKAVDASFFEAPLGESGLYVLRFQPEPDSQLAYAMTIELESALPFPVRGFHLSAVRGFFGDRRARGTRRHQGIDIFVARGTPVLAVADGHAEADRDELGGTVVRLYTSDTSYYYAHLDRAAVDLPRRVRAGEVLGYVGNSGNARRMQPHLHFSIHPHGRDVIDPLPHFLASRFDELPFGAARALMPSGSAARPPAAGLEIVPDRASGGSARGRVGASIWDASASSDLLADAMGTAFAPARPEPVGRDPGGFDAPLLIDR